MQNILSIGGKKMQKISKALAIADVVRTASKSVSEQVSGIAAANAKSVAASPLTGGMPFVAFNTIKGALGIASTVASSVKSIQAIKGDAQSTSSSSVGGSSSGGGGGGAQAQAPSFNIVGQSSTNQLASAINGQNERPIKTYVTSNDISTAQAMDRNIVEGASI